MRLGSLSPGRSRLPAEFSLQRLAQQRQCSEPFDPVQPRLDVQEGRSEPALLLIRGAPVIDLIGTLPQERIERLQAVGSLQAHAKPGEQAQAVQSQRLLEPLVETRDRRLVDKAQLLTQPTERPRRGLVGRLLIGGLELTAKGRALALREVGEDILPLVPLTALDHSQRPEDRLNRLAQALRAVDDTEQAVLSPQPALHQLPEEGGTDRLVFCGGLDEAEHDLLPRQGDPQCDHHAVLGEGLTIEDHDHHVVRVQSSLLEGLELASAGSDEAAGDRRRTQAEGLWNRLRTDLIVPAAQAEEELPEQPGIRSPGGLQLLVRRQGDLLIPGQIPDPLVRDRELLIGQVDRSPLVPPADVARDPAGALVLRASEPGHLGDQGLGCRSQSEGNERLDERDGRVDVLDLRVYSQPSKPDVFHLAFSLDAEYPFHEATPCLCEVIGCGQQLSHLTGVASLFQLTMAHPPVNVILLTIRFLPVTRDIIRHVVGAAEYAMDVHATIVDGQEDDQKKEWIVRQTRNLAGEGRFTYIGLKDPMQRILR